MPFRDLPTACGGDSAARTYEETMSFMERIAQAGYEVKVQWKCEFQLPEEAEVEQSLPLTTRDGLYGGRTEAMRLHYRAKEGEETIQYVDVMSLYPWVCKYFKFPVGHRTRSIWTAGTYRQCSQKNSYGTRCSLRGTFIILFCHTGAKADRYSACAGRARSRDPKMSAVTRWFREGL